mmetsp:Transcript_55755/g.130453  ORF Transcript_55755/g.130453 Transcript_55755/m.130453 type:complete len:108 (-) Transcript_55755:373-696(-)
MRRCDPNLLTCSMTLEHSTRCRTSLPHGSAINQSTCKSHDTRADPQALSLIQCKHLQGRPNWKSTSTNFMTGTSQAHSSSASAFAISSFFSAAIFWYFSLTSAATSL